MIRRIVCFIILIVSFLIWGCSEHTVQPYQPALANGRVVGSIHGVVTDFCSRALFDSGAVTISWVVNGVLRDTTTNNLGYYSITDLPSGDYVITFSGASHYAISRVSVTIPELEDILDCCPPTNEDYQHSVTQNVSLFRKNAGLQGHVYKRHSDLSITKAQGVTVVADYSFYLDDYDYDWFEGFNVYPGKYTTITNSDGFFSFDSLPGAWAVSLYTLPYTYGTYEWGMEFTIAELIQNSVYTVDDFVLDISSPYPFIVQNNFIDEYKFVLTDDLFATFSKRMYMPCFGYELSFYDITMDDEFTVVECDTSWFGGLTLTIDPYVDLRPATEYTLHLWGRSMDDHDFDEEYTFRTQMGIEFVSTNLERAEGVFDQFPVESNIEINFSMPIMIDHPDNMVALYDPALLWMDIDLSLSADSRTLIINPPENLEYNQEYTLVFILYSMIPGDFIQMQFIFETETDQVAPGQVTGFALDMGGGIDWNTTVITFSWTSLANADAYHIFAYDNYRNSDHVLLDSFGAIDILTSQTGTVTLPVQFDYYQDDVTQTPFLEGTDVSFYAVATNDAGIGPQSSPVTLSDNTDPTIVLGAQSGSVNNATDDVITVTISVTSTTGEYLSAVTIATEDGGDPTFTLPEDNVNFSWNTAHHNKTGGTITITVPGNTDYTGDDIVVHCTDTSGNSVTVRATLN